MKVFLKSFEKDFRCRIGNWGSEHLLWNRKVLSRCHSLLPGSLSVVEMSDYPKIVLLIYAQICKPNLNVKYDFLLQSEILFLLGKSSLAPKEIIFRNWIWPKCNPEICHWFLNHRIKTFGSLKLTVHWFEVHWKYSSKIPSESYRAEITPQKLATKI